jgi:uncharacterized protein (TIGR03083 family)
MEIAEHIAYLEADGSLLADAAQRAGWDAPVPSLNWDVRQLVTHTGGIHRWAADIVGNVRSTLDTDAGRAVGSGPDDDELLDWFVAGHAALVETLSAAPADLDVATFLPAPSPLAFWARRQAHETAVHRADAEAAAGAVTPFVMEFAQDGIAELLRGFAARKSNAIERAACLALNSVDGPSWLVTLGGERILAAEGDDSTGDLVVSGTSSDLYLWLWNRPSAASTAGDEELAELWANSVRVRWS